MTVVMAAVSVQRKFNIKWQSDRLFEKDGK
jgi:hypothetical protein